MTRLSYFSISLFLFSFLLYVPSLKGDFVWDDPTYVRDNPFLREPDALTQVLSFKTWSRPEVDDNVRPVYLLSMILDRKIWGDDPFGYHLTNVLLHSLNTLLVFFLASALFQIATTSSLPALFAALVFAAHPLATEAVCPVTFREDLLVTFFLLLGLILALSNVRLSKVLTPLCLLLSAMSKESGLMGPLILAFMIPLTTAPGMRLREIRAKVLPSALVVFLFGAARFSLPAKAETILDAPSFLGGSFWKMLALEPRILAYQLKTLFFPFNLCADPLILALRFLSLGLCLFLLFVAILLVNGLIRRNALALFGFAFAFLALLPVSNLDPIFRPVADRFLYLPLAGLSLALGALFLPQRSQGEERDWNPGAGRLGAGLALVSVLALLTLARQRDWRDNVVLWTKTLKQNPLSLTAANNLGFALWSQGRFQESIEAWRQAQFLSRNRDADPWAGMAIGLYSLGRGREARAMAEHAASLDPRYKDPDHLVRLLIWERRQAEALRAVWKGS